MIFYKQREEQVPPLRQINSSFIKTCRGVHCVRFLGPSRTPVPTINKDNTKLQGENHNQAFPSGEGGPLAVDEESLDIKLTFLLIRQPAPLRSVSATFPAGEGFPVTLR